MAKSDSEKKSAKNVSRNKRKLIQKLRQTQHEEDYNSARTSGFHRSAYHRHFDGYKEIKFKDPTGKTVIQRTYVGDWYEPDFTRENQIKLRVLYVLLTVFGVGLFIYAATRVTACNTALYVALFQGLAVAMLIWLIYVLIFYVPSLGRLTVGDYNSIHQPLIRASFMMTLCMWACAAGAILSLILNGYLMDILCCLLFAAAGLMFFIINRMESRLIYHVLPNDTEAPDESVEIT